MVANLAFFVIFYSAILTVPYCYRMYAASSYPPEVPQTLIEEYGHVNSVHIMFLKDETFTSNKLYLYTRDGNGSYNYNYTLDYSKNQLEFYVKSKQGAHITLYKSGNGPYYEIYIQESNNKTALLRDGKLLIESDPTPFLDPLSYKKFWIKWGSAGIIEFGNPENGTILSYRDANPFTFNYFAVRTSTEGAHKPNELIRAYWIFDRDQMQYEKPKNMWSKWRETHQIVQLPVPSFFHCCTSAWLQLNCVSIIYSIYGTTTSDFANSTDRTILELWIPVIDGFIFLSSILIN